MSQRKHTHLFSVSAAVIAEMGTDPAKLEQRRKLPVTAGFSKWQEMGGSNHYESAKPVGSRTSNDCWFCFSLNCFFQELCFFRHIPMFIQPQVFFVSSLSEKEKRS